jgi:hypothetical protein
MGGGRGQRKRREVAVPQVGILRLERDLCLPRDRRERCLRREAAGAKRNGGGADQAVFADLRERRVTASADLGVVGIARRLSQRWLGGLGHRGEPRLSLVALGQSSLASLSTSARTPARSPRAAWLVLGQRFRGRPPAREG